MQTSAQTITQWYREAICPLIHSAPSVLPPPSTYYPQISALRVTFVVGPRPCLWSNINYDFSCSDVKWVRSFRAIGSAINVFVLVCTEKKLAHILQIATHIDLYNNSFVRLFV